MTKDDTKGIISVSDEKSFIYHESFNRGHVQVPSMIVSCLGLSSNAKAVYNYISKHIFEKGQTAFPSIPRIAYGCGCTEKSVITYVDELVEKGFIVKEVKGKGKSNHYHLIDLNEVNLLKVSEMFWKVAVDLQRRFSWKRLLGAKDRILKAMVKEECRLQDIEVTEETKSLLQEEFIKVVEGGEVELSFLPKNRKFIENSRKAEKPAEIETPPTAPVKRERRVKGGLNRSHYGMLDVNKWREPQFREYFYDRYLDATDHPHPRNDLKHKGMIQRVVKLLEDDKELIKTYIDTFFEIGYEVLTLEYFSSSTRIGEIQTYLISGKKPYFLEKKQKEEVPTSATEGTKYKGMSGDKIKELFGGDEDGQE